MFVADVAVDYQIGSYRWQNLYELHKTKKKQAVIEVKNEQKGLCTASLSGGR